MESKKIRIKDIPLKQLAELKEKKGHSTYSRTISYLLSFRRETLRKMKYLRLELLETKMKLKTLKEKGGIKDESG